MQELLTKMKINMNNMGQSNTANIPLNTNLLSSFANTNKRENQNRNVYAYNNNSQNNFVNSTGLASSTPI